MALIGSITIGMKTEVKKLTKGFNQARSLVGGFAGKVMSIGAPIAAIFSTAAIEEFARRSLENAGATEVMAKKLGTSADKLQTLRYEAKMTGTDVESLELAMQKMNVKLGEARIKGGPTADTLARLGLSVTKITAMDPAEAFSAIATAISKVKNPMEQAADAVEIFGKGGVNIVNTLRAGPERLGALAKEAQRFGLALNAVDAAKVVESRHALSRMGFAVEGLGNTLVGKLAPGITKIADLTTDWIVQIVNGEGPLAELGPILVSVFDSGVNALSGFVDFIGPQLEWIGSTVKATFDTAGMVLRNWGDLWTIGQLKATEAFANIFAIADTFPENFGRMTGWLGRNWANLIRDITATFLFGLQNMIKNAADFGKALVRAVKGQGFDFTPTNLLEGLTIATEKLPELVKPAWVSMQSEIDKVGQHIADKEQKRQDDLAGRIKKPLTSPIAALDAAGQGEAKKFGGLAELGSKEAHTAILKFQGGKPEDTAKEAVKIAQQQLGVQQQQLAETRKDRGGAEIFAFS